jgi:hypothetical protein
MNDEKGKDLKGGCSGVLHCTASTLARQPFLSAGIYYCVVRCNTSDVSEEYFASIFSLY